MKLRTLIEEWAKQSGVELAEIAEETEDHRFSADLYELELQTVMKDILPTMGFMYHDREGSVKILTLEDYHALPPVRIDYPVPSKDVDYALRLLSKALGKKNIESEPDPENATIAIKATWAEHDRIQELIDLYGRLEPTPIYPEMVWPDTLPEHFTREPPQKDDSLEEQVRIAHTVEIRHGSATRLADKLRELQPLHPGERLILIPMANRIVLRATGERIQEILEVVSYLDDPVWRSEE
ncbi:MAG: hypothetical protein JJU29_11910 [Verrucomicrobia bacterium]|nr:hypothetical protein [Verrucomicrobiota bacterium]MCH8514151.1 hypothetical protein [Kiritimatiellia bacterium]